MMLAAGCSGADAGSSDTSEATGAFPVTIEHVFGSTTVPEKPERIVALGVSDADVVLALGQVPVGNTGFTFYETGLGPWAEGLVGDAELTRIQSDSEPNLEQMAGLAPDLILGLAAGVRRADVRQAQRNRTHRCPSTRNRRLLGPPRPSDGHHRHRPRCPSTGCRTQRTDRPADRGHRREIPRVRG